MGDFPIVDGGRWIDHGTLRSGDTRGITVAPNASAHVKGTVVQVTSSSAFDADCILVQIYMPNNNNADYLLDVLIGSAPEQVLIPNLIFTDLGNQGQNIAQYMFPIHIPKASRLSVQCQCGIASGLSMHVNFLLGQCGLDRYMTVGSKVTAYGVVTATTRGTPVDPGGTANTPVTTEIDPSIDDELSGVVIGIGGANNFALSDGRWIFDLMGGAPTEQVLISGLMHVTDAGSDVHLPTAHPFFPMRVAKGTRLSIRSQCSITTAADRVFDVVLYGVH